MKNSEGRVSKIGIGAMIGGPDAELLGQYCGQLVRLFKALDNIPFCSEVNFYGICVIVDASTYAFHGKAGTRSLRLRKAAAKVSLDIHITESEWRGKSNLEVKKLFVDYFAEAFRLMTARLKKEGFDFDDGAFHAATTAVLLQFMASDEPSLSKGEAEVQNTLREYVDARNLALALGESIPELKQRDGFVLEPDPKNPDRVRVRQVNGN